MTVTFTNLRPQRSSTPERITTGIAELDRVAGGGFNMGGTYLLAADPGAGKSTLLLQAAAKIAKRYGMDAAVYLTAEELVGQVQERARRFGVEVAPVRLAETENVGQALAVLAEHPPAFMVVDSIQTMTTGDPLTTGDHLVPGGTTTALAVITELVKFAHKYGTVIVIVCHVNKTSRAAGPNTLQHAVDAVLYLKAKDQFRLLTATKNRFGSTAEVGLFKMTPTGLQGIS